MRKISVFAQLPILGILALVGAPWAQADTVTVNAYDNIYASGTQSGLAAGSPTSGTGVAPGTETGQPISASGFDLFTFSAITSSNLAGGLVSMNFEGGGFNGNGTDLNDADGLTPTAQISQIYGPSAVSSSTGFESISGIIAPGVGYLVGVFVGPGGPTGTAPSSLNFTGSAVGGYTTVAGGTGFTSLSPLLDQTFFIGDGLSGDGSGSVQTFLVPTGATELFLGTSDACGYAGPPTGCYGDNVGSYIVDVTPQDQPIIPEPSSLLLFGTGIIGMAGMFRRKLLSI